MRGKWHSHVRGETTRYEVHLINPLLFTTFVLEPDLDNPHWQSSVLSKLLPHLSGRLGVLVEAAL